MSKVEHSIGNAHYELILNAKSYVYIENQFLCTTLSDDKKPGDIHPVENGLGRAICDRILRAHENGEDFKVYRVSTKKVFIC